MRRTLGIRIASSTLLSFLLLLPAQDPGAGQESASISSAQLEALQGRVIGPAVTGGRVHDVEALVGRHALLFQAAAEQL